MTRYELKVRTASRCELDATHQSYRKVVKILMSFIPVAQNVLHNYQILQVKNSGPDQVVNEVANGSFYGGKKI